MNLESKQVIQVNSNSGFLAAFTLIPKVVDDLWRGRPEQAFERTKNNAFMPWLVIILLSIAFSVWVVSSGSIVENWLAGLSEKLISMEMEPLAEVTDRAIGRLITFIFACVIIFPITLMVIFSIRALFMRSIAAARGVPNIPFTTLMSRIGVGLLPLTLIALPVNVIGAVVGLKSIPFLLFLIPLLAALTLYAEVLIYLGNASLVSSPKSILLPYIGYWTLTVYITCLLLVVAAIMTYMIVLLAP